MTNGEKYKGAKERAEAFAAYAKPLAPRNEYEFGVCAFEWLDLEAEDEAPLPCPFCGGKCSVHILSSGNPTVLCDNDDCFYHASLASTRKEAIAMHNRVARAEHHDAMIKAQKERDEARRRLKEAVLMLEEIWRC